MTLLAIELNPMMVSTLLCLLKANSVKALFQAYYSCDFVQSWLTSAISDTQPVPKAAHSS